MKIIKPNSTNQVIDGISIFLAGTIDNGKISTDIENIRTNSKDIDFTEILKSMNREKLLNELL